MNGEIEPIRVLIADDHPVMRDGIAAAVRSAEDMAVVGEASDGAEAIVRNRELQPDVLLMDLQMPGVDGLQATTAICRDGGRTKIIVLTSYPGDARVKRALSSGAAAYLLKTATRDEILAAVRTVAKGKRFVAPEIATDMASHALDPMLTERELRVLSLVAKGHTNKHIANVLSISASTVKDRVKSIMAKLGAVDRTHAVTLARDRGFLDS